MLLQLTSLLRMLFEFNFPIVRRHCLGWSSLCCIAMLTIDRQLRLSILYRVVCSRLDSQIQYKLVHDTKAYIQKIFISTFIKIIYYKLRLLLTSVHFRISMKSFCNQVFANIFDSHLKLIFLIMSIKICILLLAITIKKKKTIS